VITVIGYDGRLAAPVPPRATLVVGGRRHLDAAQLPPGARTLVMGDVDAAVAAVLDHDGDAAVLASGDPGFFGIARRLRAAGASPRVLPAASSVAQAFARAGLGWDDALVVSAHGRDARPALAACRAHPKVAVLTDAACGPAEVGAALAGTGRALVVCERLGEVDERVERLSAELAAGRTDWRHPNVVLVLGAERVREPAWVAGHAGAPAGWALAENSFEHRDGMVTKQEVRAQVLAHLAPRLGALVWDVGAGCGSVAVECARFGAAVVAVERDAGQVARIERNARRHDVDLQVVAGCAPDCLEGLPDPDAVFVGGGGPDVVAACAARTPRRLVVALAAVERVGPTWRALAAAGYDVAGAQLQASRLSPLPDGVTRLAAQNPVFILRGERR